MGITFIVLCILYLLLAAYIALGNRNVDQVKSNAELAKFWVYIAAVILALIYFWPRLTAAQEPTVHSATDHMSQLKKGDKALFGPLKVPCTVVHVDTSGIKLEGLTKRITVVFDESQRTSSKWEWELTPAPESNIEQEQTS